MISLFQGDVVLASDSIVLFQDLNNDNLGCVATATTSCTITSSVPEPVSVAMLGAGLAGLGFLRPAPTPIKSIKSVRLLIVTIGPLGASWFLTDQS